MTLPITILGGYLGSGKTTMVNHLLRHADGLRLAVLVNEFGALPIDRDLIVAEDEDIISIAGGCVCCSYGNDLTLALLDLAKLDPAPDHVLLESSGVALPGAIAASVSLLGDYALDGVVVLADAETIRAQARDAYVGDTIERQLCDADLVVLNKTDLIADTDRTETEAWVKTVNPDAEIIGASFGQVPPTILLQSFLSRDRGDDARDTHRIDAFRTVALAIDHAVDADRLAKGLSSAELGLVRAKGFVRTPDGSMMTIQVVGRRSTVSPMLDTASTGLVAIGNPATFNETSLNALIASASSI